MNEDLRTDRDCFRVSQNVRASISGDGLVLLDVQGGLVLASNPIGARIWQLVEQQVGCREIAHQLAHDYRIPIDRAQSDVVAFVTTLEARGLVIGASTC